MSKLKDVFTESYIAVPDSKIDLVDELAEANEELEAQVNEATTKAMAISEELVSLKRAAVIREASKDLAETQVEKLTSLAESVDFENEKAFAQKVATLKESYFSKTKTAESIISEAEYHFQKPLHCQPCARCNSSHGYSCAKSVRWASD